LKFSKSEQKTAIHYSKRLQNWIDEYENPTGYPFTRIRLNRILDYLNLNNISRKSVLDVGCGVGIPTLKITESGGLAHGFDVSSELISFARKEAEKYDVEASFVVGSALNKADYPSGSFDLVMALGVFQHIDNDVKVLAQMKNCLAENGLLIVSFRNPLFAFSTFNRPSYELYKELFKEFLTSADADILDKFLKSKLELSHPPQRKGDGDDPVIDDLVFKYHNPFTVDKLLKQVGLKVLDIDFYRHHSTPPLLSENAPETFEGISLKLDAQANDWRSMFLCSTYILYCGHK